MQSNMRLCGGYGRVIVHCQLGKELRGAAGSYWLLRASTGSLPFAHTLMVDTECANDGHVTNKAAVPPDRLPALQWPVNGAATDRVRNRCGPLPERRNSHSGASGVPVS
jgi:hypothetical protein